MTSVMGFSSYVSGTGLFVSSALMYWALYWFVVCIALLALTNVETYSEGAVDPITGRPSGGYLDVLSSGASSYPTYS